MKNVSSADCLIRRVRGCTLCRDALPLEPRPIIQASTEARILIAGQAPGRIAHEKGRPFDDASGERLRNWLGVTREEFYDPSLFAIIPMGFCYPGSYAKPDKKSGDKPPRPECAPAWRQPLLDELTGIRLTLLVGKYAIEWHLKQKISVSSAVEQWQTLWPHTLVMPHPSPRNNLWLRRHPDFESEIVPRLRQRVAELIRVKD